MPVVLNIVESETALGVIESVVVIESASEPGPAGVGVPTGGTAGQVLTKDSGTDFDTSWEDPVGGGSGVVETIVAGSNIDVDATDPANPVVSVETLVDADIPASIARDSEVTAAVDAEAALARNADNLTSGTVADARIPATIARDAEVSAAVSASEAGQVRDGDAAGGVLSGTYPNPGFAADMATQAELDAVAAAKQPLDADLTALAAAGNSAVLAATTASFLAADETKLDGVEAGADVTDAANVAAAGAVMESDFDANTVLKADSDNTPIPLTMGASTILARLAAGGIVAATPAQLRTLLNVEDGATADQSAAEILAALLTVDGAGSGLDADLLDGQSSAAFATAASLTAHIDDIADAHDASAISIADAGNDFTATDVEGALAELQSDHEADATALTDHTGDTSGAHAASAIAFTPAGTIAATDVQAAIEEVASEAGGGSSGWTLVDEDSANVTSGDITLNQTAITNLTAFDLTLQGAAIGDIVKVYSNFAVSAVAQFVGFDLYTMVGGSPVNSFGPGLSASLSTTSGLRGWFVPNLANTFPVSGNARYVLVSGDIDSGDVTIRLRYAKTTSTARTLFASATDPARIWAELWRPPA